MSMINFIKSPFPDNHNGFDYTPKSFMDVQHEVDSATQSKQAEQMQSKILSLFASIFK